MSDTLGVYGPWKTTLHATVRGKQKNVPISISYRYKILGKRMATCRFTMEFRNDTDKKLKFVFLAGNDRTNGFQGSIGTTREKIDLDPKEKMELTYMMPSKGFKDDGGAPPASGAASWTTTSFLAIWKPSKPRATARLCGLFTPSLTFNFSSPYSTLLFLPAGWPRWRCCWPLAPWPRRSVPSRPRPLASPICSLAPRLRGRAR